jgi:hypothetical protein
LGNVFREREVEASFFHYGTMGCNFLRKITCVITNLLIP